MEGGRRMTPAVTRMVAEYRMGKLPPCDSIHYYLVGVGIGSGRESYGARPASRVLRAGFGALRRPAWEILACSRIASRMGWEPFGHLQMQQWGHPR